MATKSPRLKFIVLDSDSNEFYIFNNIKEVESLLQDFANEDEHEQLSDVQVFHGIELKVKNIIKIDLKP